MTKKVGANVTPSGVTFAPPIFQTKTKEVKRAGKGPKKEREGGQESERKANYNN